MSCAIESLQLVWLVYGQPTTARLFSQMVQNLSKEEVASSEGLRAKQKL